jgi:hypothetical protein
MSVVGMLPGPAGQSDDGVAMDPDEASGRPDAAPLVEVVQDGEGLVLGQMGVEQGRTFAFGEAVLAGLAVEEADVVLFAVAGADGEVAGVAETGGGAVGVLTAEAREVVHAEGRSGSRGSKAVRGHKSDAAPILRSSPTQCSIIPGHDR